MRSRPYLVTAIATVALLLVWAVWDAQRRRHDSAGQPLVSQPAASAAPAPQQDTSPTTVWAHNLRLRKGPDFRIYIRWIRGQMERTNPARVPSLEDQGSFIFAIDKGLIRANLGDIAKYVNTALASRSPLKNVSVDGEGNELRLSGTLHKVVLLPVQIVTTVSAMPDGRVHLHVDKISVLKLPVKALMNGIKIGLPDVVGERPLTGVEVQNNDLYLDTAKMLPPPHIRGKITSIAIQRPDIVVTYGNSPNDEAELAKWHNFLRLRGGTVSFGKLTMNHADLTLIDASDDTWFDLDLASYQKQLVQGYSRMTDDGGLEMFMPGVGRPIAPGAIPLATLRDRRHPLPPTPASR